MTTLVPARAAKVALYVRIDCLGAPEAGGGAAEPVTAPCFAIFGEDEKMAIDPHCVLYLDSLQGYEKKSRKGNTLM